MAMDFYQRFSSTIKQQKHERLNDGKRNKNKLKIVYEAKRKEIKDYYHNE